MKKQITILAILLFAAAGTLFASGAVEENSVAPGQLLELEGRLSFEGGYPTINSAQGEYRLLYPYHLNYSIEAEEGDSVKVSGYPIDQGWGFRSNIDESPALRLVRAEIGDKVYELPNGPAPAYGMGGGYCWDNGGTMMGGYRQAPHHRGRGRAGGMGRW